MPSNLSQPGIGDPYWFEWYVGLDYVISLLVGTYGIDSVTFQEAGLEGVDDVVVRRANGLPMVCVQAKHEKVSTSSTDNLTFSSLIRERKTLNGAKPKKSLLASLAAGWKQVINTEEASPEIVLYTNRELGINNTKAEYRSTEYNRLPLGEFWTTVSEKMETATLLADISFDDQDLSTQWCEFADSTKLDKDDIVPFLKSLRIEAGAPSLNAQEQRLTDRLRDEVCAGSQELASAVFRSLAAELRRWTTAAGDNVVTANIVVKCVCALNQNPLAKPIDVSLPNPIFPSRERACSSLCEKLAASDSKVVFLQGRPGVGKTRLVSCLCEQIIPNPVRFYSFKPLDTDDFSYSPDAGTVSSKELWSTLLNQLRDALELSDVKPQIPILNDLCSDDQLREEALRLAEVLSCRRGSKTILVIDGIDHAARGSVANVGVRGHRPRIVTCAS